ncbi:MAG: hypothetical protein ACRESE_02180 [Gammaproteobacteria bacterium]
MILLKRVSYIGFLLAAALWLAACSNHAVAPSNMAIKGAPNWVNQGSRVLNDQDRRLIHGVGSAPAMNDLALQTTTADKRARTEVIKVLASFMHVMYQDYSASNGNGQDQQTEQSASREIESVINRNLSSVQVIAHWINPQNGAVWSLAELDMKGVKAIVANSQEMNAGFKGFFANHADKVFDGMSNTAANKQ